MVLFFFLRKIKVAKLMSMRVSIVIPTKDEPRIQELVNEINDNLQDFDHEIIIVDKSKKKPSLKGAIVIEQKTAGLAKAILEGIRIARYENILVMDGDFSHDPKDVKKLLEALRYSELVIGSKYLPASRVEESPVRKVISRLANITAKIVLNLRVNDSISGFFAFRKNIIKNCRMKGIGFKLSTELLFRTKGKVKVEEVPIIFRKRREGKSKFNVIEIFRFLNLLMKLRLESI